MVNVFKILETMCEIDEEDKLKVVPVIISGDSLSYYATNIKDVKDTSILKL